MVHGELCIRTDLSQMRLRWRPEPLAEELLPGRTRWLAFWPDFRLVRPGETPAQGGQAGAPMPAGGADEQAQDRKADAFIAFRNELPPELVALVEPFLSHQWALLVMLHHQPSTVDLALSNPVLAYCLASNNEFRGTHVKAAAFQAISHSYARQRAILEWLGFPGTEAMVRLMRKIPPQSAAPSILRRLRIAVARDSRVIELLAHQPLVTTGVLELVVTLSILDVVTPKLLLEVSRQQPEAGGQSVADALHGSMDLLRSFAPRRRVAPFTRVEDALRFREEVDAEHAAHQERMAEALQRFREEVAAAHAAHQQRRAEALQRARTERWAQLRRANQQALERHRRLQEQERRSFPRPPVPGTPDIIPLTSVAQLKAEGREMRHCVGQYGTLVDSGATYVYRVMAPERATLSIVRGEEGCWRRADIKAKSNRKVGAETVGTVDAWLRRYRVSV
jgi:hypothetical protein